MFFECLAEESHFTFSVTNQEDEDLWEEPSDAGISHNRPMGLRHGRMAVIMVMMVMMMMMMTR
jgi:hypothetical protein